MREAAKSDPFRPEVDVLETHTGLNPGKDHRHKWRKESPYHIVWHAATTKTAKMH
jgi:hypothetical protein